MVTTAPKISELANALYRVKRGLSAYVSYLAACEMNQTFSEYVLYEPILRILVARGFWVKCEYKCPGIKQPSRGDKKRIDFYAVGHSLELAIEIKWATSQKPDIRRDVEKLQAFLASKPKSIALLCLFGRKSSLKALEFTAGQFKERGSALYADLGKTKYGCRIYQLRPAKESPPMKPTPSIEL